MKVYGIFNQVTDGFTYSCESLYKVFEHEADMETEIVRLELIYLEAKEYYKNHSNKEYYEWFASLPDDDRAASVYDERIGFPFTTEEIDVL